MRRLSIVFLLAMSLGAQQPEAAKTPAELRVEIAQLRLENASLKQMLEETQLQLDLWTTAYGVTKARRDNQQAIDKAQRELEAASAALQKEQAAAKK